MRTRRILAALLTLSIVVSGPGLARTGNAQPAPPAPPGAQPRHLRHPLRPAPSSHHPHLEPSPHRRRHLPPAIRRPLRCPRSRPRA